jgi:endonuclease/exonuclease/phosphatase family metal-dependent hydrolase
MARRSPACAGIRSVFELKGERMKPSYDHSQELWAVMVWNMGLMSPGKRRASDNWSYLEGLIRKYRVKVALLNEADVYTLASMNKTANREGRSIPAAFSEEGTHGRDYWTKDSDRILKDRTRHTAAVVAPTGLTPLDERAVRAESPSYPHRRPDTPFIAHRPGTWVAAKTSIGSQDIACVSLYGLMDELSDASMHTSLSEISPIFSDPAHKDLVLLGGDFNTSTAVEIGQERHRLVLDRIEAYGMHDCLKEWRSDKRMGPLPGCPCNEPATCAHTLTRLYPDESAKQVPWLERIAPQVDYLFASTGLANRVEEVVDISPEEWESSSDHRPIVVTFRY